MYTLFAEIFGFIISVGVAVYDFIMRRGRRLYQETISIEAPADLVWRVATAKRIKFDGLFPMDIVDTDDLGNNTFLAHIKIGEAQYKMGFEEKERQDGEAILWKIIPELSDKEIVVGDDQFSGCIVTKTEKGADLTIALEATIQGFFRRIFAFIGLRQGLHRIKRYAEREVEATSGDAALVRDFFLLSLITGFASFWYLFGASEALLLLVIIFLHEIGHAIAMWMVGIPVRGIYIIPFMGGIAIGGREFKTPIEDGFVSLMGPAFSLIPTFILFDIYMDNGQAEYGWYALMFAVINGFNLLPILPLDGGHVLRALLSMVSTKLAQFIGWVGLSFSFLLAVYLQTWVFAGFVLLVGYGISMLGGKVFENTKTSGPAGILLFLGFIFTFAIYLWIFWITIGDAEISARF